MSDDSKLSSYLFYVEIDGIETARFQKCEGLEAETESFEYEEGGGEVHHFQGRTRYQNLVLEKGINDNNELFNWFQSITKDEKIERKNGSIVLKNTDGEELKRWNFFRALPCRWIGPKLDAKDRSSFAVERIEIAHEGIEVDNDAEPFELKVDPSKWTAQAGMSDVPIYYDNYGNPSSDPNVVTGQNMGEPVDVPASTKITNTAENHLDENYYDSNSCDEWAAKVIKEAGYDLAVDGYFGKDTKKEVENYQKDKKLQVDGMAGIETHTSLISYK